MFRSLPSLRSSGRTVAASLASSRSQPSITRQPLYRLDARRTAIRFASSSQPPKPPSADEERDRLAHKKLEPNPEGVSSTSSVRTVLEATEGALREPPGVNSNLKHDIGLVKDTFRLDTVPRESHILGLAGTLPYLATSVSTVFLALNLNTDVPSGNRFYNMIFMEHETAQYLLDFIEPLQLGYGAVIISFLGAIHWGLEYAEKKPQHDRTRFRYGTGLAASIVAWPTMLMPLEYALTTQFGAFVALYYADSRATRKGWAPVWYAKYRFLLTAMVGLAIFISLVGRAEISQRNAHNKQSLRARVEESGIADKNTDWTKLEKEEKDRIKKEKAKKAREEEQAKKKKAQDEKKGKGKKKDEKQADNDKDSAKNKGGEEDDSQESQKGKDKDTDESEDTDESKDNDESKDSDESMDSNELKDSDEPKDSGDSEDSDKSEDGGKSKDSDKSKGGNKSKDYMSKDNKSKDNKSKDNNSKDNNSKDNDKSKDTDESKDDEPDQDQEKTGQDTESDKGSKDNKKG
ncbi:hypothetical protein THAR02_01698 [Trichoderma harzianum]|uniref:Mitochondrial inner membrane protein 1 n=1 Tax=Trichoderma harzianum TaxID=5544 RepID=A0A0F9XNU0_TRIHA|nr:hypothetical protein THAR02_01698 [Trichoderma harzianum]